MLQKQLAVVRVVEIAGQQRQRHSELRGFRAAHVDHALGIDEIGEVVIDDAASHVEPAPFEVRAHRASKDVLKAVVFRAVVVAIDGAILRVDSAGSNHELLRERVL